MRFQWSSVEANEWPRYNSCIIFLHYILCHTIVPNTLVSRGKSGLMSVRKVVSFILFQAKIEVDIGMPPVPIFDIGCAAPGLCFPASGSVFVNPTTRCKYSFLSWPLPKRQSIVMGSRFKELMHHLTEQKRTNMSAVFSNGLNLSLRVSTFFTIFNSL